VGAQTGTLLRRPAEANVVTGGITQVVSSSIVAVCHVAGAVSDGIAEVSGSVAEASTAGIGHRWGSEAGDLAGGLSSAVVSAAKAANTATSLASPRRMIRSSGKEFGKGAVRSAVMAQGDDASPSRSRALVGISDLTVAQPWPEDGLELSTFHGAPGDASPADADEDCEDGWDFVNWEDVAPERGVGGARRAADASRAPASRSNHGAVSLADGTDETDETDEAGLPEGAMRTVHFR